MKISENGINSLLKAHEGLRLKAYDDMQPNKNITSASQVVGTLTIGYGHTGSDVFVGQQINEQKATALLITDTASAQATVERLVKVALTTNMNDALIDFVFNAGSGNFSSSTLLKKLNASDYKGAADEFLRWNKSAGQVIAGLTVRCNARRELFLTGLGTNTYYAADGKSYKPESSNGLLKLITIASALGSL